MRKIVYLCIPKDENGALTAMKNNFRRFCTEYRPVFVFGFILAGCVSLIYYIAHYIPMDLYVEKISAIMNGCIAMTSLIGALALFRHNKGVHVRILWGVELLVWTAMATLFLMRIFSFYSAEALEDTISLHGIELLVGNIFAWMLMLYPTAVLRPGYLTLKNAWWPLIPAFVIFGLDEWLQVDLSWLLALCPVVIAFFLIAHIRAYRIWCEENYSSMDDIDVQWFWKYIVMYLINGGCYIGLSFHYDAAHAFTQQCMLLFMLMYSTEQIMFRPDPHELIRRANPNHPAPQEEEEEEEEAQAPDINYEAYRQILEGWMVGEKPYLNPDFRLMDLRQILPLNRTYLSQFINHEYGCSFYQFVMNYRIEEAKRLMKENPFMKLQDVGEQSGFSSQAVFSRIFARETGMTPTEWSSEQNNQTES